MIIVMLYFSKKLNAIPGRNIATAPAPIDAPQTGAPIAQACSAPNPSMTVIMLKADRPLDFAMTALSFMFLMKQVITSEVSRMKAIPRIE